MRTKTSVLGLVALLHSFEPALLEHSQRVSSIAQTVAQSINLDPTSVKVVSLAGLLHDVGKIEIPQAILNKAGQLTLPEWAVMKSHAAKTLSILSTVGFTGEFAAIPQMAAAHHESPDGKGYPNGTSRQSIGTKIISAADCYEAATAIRCYQHRLTHSEAISLLKSRHMDSQVVEAIEHLLPKSLMH